MNDARDLCDYIDASPSPFHAVAETARRLDAAGFTRLDERDAWALTPGDARYVTRADASIVAFRVGAESPVGAGFRIVGAHTDSPCLRLKPQPALTKEGFAQLAVEVYGGVLLYTWLDRDLGLAGRVVVEDSGGLAHRLVRVDRPIARVPSLAIHLDREVNERGLVLNRQSHMPPIFALGDAQAALDAILSGHAGSGAIRGFDLGLYDVTRATLGGHDEPFVFAGRLDNLASCHAAVRALADAPKASAATRVVALFDHEEVGSASGHGAEGPLLEDVLARVVEATDPGAQSGLRRAIAASFCVSADMAHAVHPSYADKHEPKHMPRIGGGPVVKTNAQQRYATDGAAAARFRALCAEANVPCQDFVTRTDLACGSTIGPITATRLGVSTVDVGSPMLSMHSIREACGAADIGAMIAVLSRLFA